MEERKHEKTRFVVLSANPVVGKEMHQLDPNDSSMMHGLKSAFEKALNEHNGSLREHIDIAFTDLSSVGDDKRIRVREGYRLNAKKNQESEKWEATWEKHSGEEIVPTTILTRVPSKQYDELVREIAEHVPILNPPEFSAVSMDKEKSYELMKKFGIKTPDSRFVYNPKEAAKALDELPEGQVFVKPIFGGGAIGDPQPYPKDKLQGLVDSGELEFGSGLVFQEYLGKEAEADTKRVFAFTRKDPETGKMIASVVGAVGRKGVPGKVLGALSAGAESYKVPPLDYHSLREISNKTAVALAEEIGKPPQMIGLDVAKKDGEYYMLEINNFAGGLYGIEEVDPHAFTILGQALISSALDADKN